MELFQMPTEESMLQVCSIWLLKMCIGSIVPELETSSKCFVSILPERKLFKHTRYAAILSKGSLDFIFRAISSCTLYLYAKPWHKRIVPIWAKKISA
jgi:hypothetical protein